MPSSLVCRRALHALSAITLVAAVADVAEAQLGGLRRAVERRVEKKAEEKVEDRIVAATLIPPTFNARTVEITAERLDRYTAAMLRRKATLAANRQRYDALQNEAAALREAAQRAENPAERRSYEQANSRYRDCRRDVLRTAEAESERQMKSLTARMQADPVAMQNDPKVREIVAAMQALVQAQESGDTAAVARETRRVQGTMGGALDSATIDRRAVSTCGVRPARPRSVITADSLSKAAEDKSSEAGALFKTTGGVTGAEVGLTDEQAYEMWERIMSWLNGVRDGAPITRMFSRAEYDLLLGRRLDLKRAFGTAE